MVDHLALLPGVYVSRRDPVGGEVVTTFDIRMKRPNREPVMNTAEIHAIEHLGATFLRNSARWKDRVLYFGPMGCRTGFYLVMRGELTAPEILPLIVETFEFIAGYDAAIPGASARDCGNWLDMNLPMARYEAGRFLEGTLSVMDESRMVYPD
jgi:S-ribosylhomocysteine lyase